MCAHHQRSAERSEETAARVARSRYRQVRLFVTQETSGRLSYSVCAKGLNQAWDQGSVLLRGSVPLAYGIDNYEDALGAVLAVLQEHIITDMG